ncbi:MAG: hypothetical protein ACKO37_09415 [Vampirovibrionales bacterium]
MTKKRVLLLGMSCVMTLAWYAFAVSLSWGAAIQVSGGQSDTVLPGTPSHTSTQPTFQAPKVLPSQTDLEQFIKAQPDMEAQVKQEWRKQWKKSQQDLLKAFDTAIQKETKSPGKEVLQLGRFLVEGEHTAHVTKHLARRADEFLPPRAMRKQVKQWILQAMAGSPEADMQLGAYYEGKNHPEAAYYHYLKASQKGNVQASDALKHLNLAPETQATLMKRLAKEQGWNKDIQRFPSVLSRAETGVKQALKLQKQSKAPLK